MTKQSDKPINVETLPALIAVAAALAFCFGYSYLISFYSEFGLAWWVEQLSVSAIALSGAPFASLCLVMTVCVVYVANIHRMVENFLLIAALIGFLVLAAIYGYIRTNFHLDASKTLSFSESVVWWIFLLSAVGFGVAISKLKSGNVFLGLTAAFISVSLFALYLPQLKGQNKAVSIIVQKDWILPRVGSGDNKGWSILGVNSSQALLIQFEGELEKRPKFKFSPLDNVEVEMTKMSFYKKIP